MIGHDTAGVGLPVSENSHGTAVRHVAPYLAKFEIAFALRSQRQAFVQREACLVDSYVITFAIRSDPLDFLFWRMRLGEFTPQFCCPNGMPFDLVPVH